MGRKELERFEARTKNGGKELERFDDKQALDTGRKKGI
jgi:hypothetical protein